MRKNIEDSTRRKFLTSMSTGLALASVPGLAAAQGKSAQSTDSGYKYEVKNGKLALSRKKEANSGANVEKDANSQVRQPPADAARFSGADLKQAVSGINDLKKQGLVEFGQANGEVTVSTTDDFRSEYSVPDDDISTADHGDTDYTADFNSWGVNHFFSLDDDDTSKAIEIALYGAGATAAASFIASVSGAGSIAAPALALLSALLGVSAGLMGNANNGHGIVIKVHHLYTGQGWCEFDGQYENDNGWPL